MTETPNAEPARKGGIRQFSRAFWIINGLELLERGAFYSLAAVLAAYMAVNLGFSESQVGFIFALLFPLLYFVPLVAAALAEKYGYKASLIVAWALLLAGYVAIPLATTFTLMVVAVVLVGLGAGAFKPIAAAIVAQSSSEGQRNIAFMIYYGGINLGAFIFPLGVGLVGVFAPHLLNTVAFAIASALIVLNVLFTVTAFRNLQPPQKDTKVLAALQRLGAVFKDRAFLILLVIFSGFWVMYAMMQTFLPLYMLDYGVMPAWFNVALLAAINPGVIIVGSVITLIPAVSRLLERWPSVPLMTAGIGLYVVGFSILGFTRSSTLFVVGIVLFSVGELMAQPAFLSYVSKIAPKDRVAVYLGYAFIPLGLGLTAGSSLGGVLYENVATGMARPALFWALMASVGLLTIAALIVYNRVLTTRRAADAGAPAPRRRFVTGPAGAALAVLLVPALVFGGVMAGTTSKTGAGGIGAAALGDLVTLDLDELTGDTAEGDLTEDMVTLPPEAAGDATFTLTWTDEAAETGTTNAPDSFRLHVTLPNGTMLMSEEVANPAGGEGTIALTVPAVTGEYRVGVELVSAGDSTVQVGPIPVPAGGAADEGNAWTLTSTTQATA